MTLVWHRVPGSIPVDASGTTSKTDGLPKDSKERPGEGEAQHADVGSLTLSEDVSRSREHRAGSTVRGRFLDSRGSFAHFDGRRLHSTEAFEGERYAIIFYVASRSQTVPPVARAEMERLGFLPTTTTEGASG